MPVDVFVVGGTGENVTTTRTPVGWQPIRVNPFDVEATVRRYRDAMGGVYAYLYDGQHTVAYLRPRGGQRVSDMEMLAHRLNAA